MIGFKGRPDAATNIRMDPSCCVVVANHLIRRCDSGISASHLMLVSQICTPGVSIREVTDSLCLITRAIGGNRTGEFCARNRSNPRAVGGCLVHRSCSRNSATRNDINKFTMRHLFKLLPLQSAFYRRRRLYGPR